MDIDTSTLQAARRNLVLISMAFIFFHFSDAKLAVETLCNGEEKSEISMLIGSFVIGNPDVLPIFAWIMFSWFLLRFFQFSNYYSDWREYTSAIFRTKYILGRIKKYSLNDTNFQYNKPQPVFGDWNWATGPAREEFSQVTIRQSQISKKLWLVLYIAITTELFGQYYFPYFIAAFAFYVTVF